MGAVWRAWDERDGRDVALKRAHPGNDERALRRAQREAGTAMQEIAMLVVHGQSSMSRLCGDARRMAKTTAARLPR